MSHKILVGAATAAESGPTATPSWLRRVVIGRNPKFTLARVVVLVLVTVVMFKFALVPVRITGISMEPNYRNGRVNLVNKLAYRNAKPQRGDVVAIRMTGERVMLMKRIIGLPGETVRISQMRIWVNGELLKEPYVKLKTHRSWHDKKFVLGEDQYLFIGDNRSMPISSHYIGSAYEHKIVGKALF